MNFVDFLKALDSLHHGALWQHLQHNEIQAKLTNLWNLWNPMKECPARSSMEVGRSDALIQKLVFVKHALWKEKLNLVDPLVTAWWPGFCRQPWPPYPTPEDQYPEDELYQHRASKYWWQQLGRSGDLHLSWQCGEPTGRNGHGCKSLHWKVMAPLITLKNMWRSHLITINTKILLFNSKIKSVLLYEAEKWRINTSIKRVQSFRNCFLRKTLKMHWLETMSNKDLFQRTN